MSGIHIEVLVASGYALFLVAVAACLERVGRHAHRRSHQYQTAGFTYRQHLNMWECPAGQYLKLWAFDSQRQVAEYRAEAKSCNSCELKKECTNSDDGRRLEHHLDSWLQSEIHRFHRGISLALLFLAALILSLEAIFETAAIDLAVLLTAMVSVAIAATRLGFGQLAISPPVKESTVRPRPSRSAETLPLS
jgi:Transposase DDE domain